MMALTATASDATLACIIRDTGMINPTIIHASPDKENLQYAVARISDLKEVFLPIIKNLQKEQLNFPRTIIFCQHQIDCGIIYQLFEVRLGENLTTPVTVSNSLPQHQLVNVFTKSTEDLVKDSVLHQFTDASSKLRVLICTAAFGMGVDCAGVTHVIHYGPPNDVETYVQQTGRAGRDGKESYCILLLARKITIKIL